MTLTKITSFSLALLLSVSSYVYAYKQEDLEKLIKTGNCEKCDLSFANLTRHIDAIKRQEGSDLQTVLNKKISLAGSDLSKADLSHASLQNCDLSNVTARDADFSRAQMFGCNLSGSDLTGAQFLDTDLRNANLQSVKGANFKAAEIENKQIGNPGLVYQFLKAIWPWYRG